MNRKLIGKSPMSLRKKTLIEIGLAILFVAFIFIRGAMINEGDLSIDFANKLQGPSLSHIFGTDQTGRDMYLRTIKGLATSIQIGFLGSLSALLVASVFALFLSFGNKYLDKVINFIIDLSLSIPHMMVLILVAIAAGRGLRGVILGIGLTHWTGLTRLLRGEILALKDENYIKISI